MMQLTRRGMLKAASLLTMAPSSPFALSVEPQFPTGIVKAVVPFPAGGATDAIMRDMAYVLERKWGQTVMVDNRGGGSGSIGASAVSQAAPDGHTIMMGISGMFLSSLLDKDIRFNLLKDFEPVSLVAVANLILVAPTSLGAERIADLASVLRRNKSRASYGSLGVGSSLHLFGEQLSKQLKLDAVHAPFRGGQQIFTELVGDRLGFAFMDLMGALPLVKAGQLKILATAGSKRSPLLPDVPTLAEEGIAGLDTRVWFGMFTTKGTPAPTVARLSADVGEAIRSSRVKDRLLATGNEPAAGTPQEMRAFLSEQVRDWSKLAVAAGLSVKA